MTNRVLLDTKTASMHEAAPLATFIHELTLKGYEPLPMQCVRQYGNMVITMGLYEKENTDGKLTQESSVPSNGSETTGVNGSDSNQGQDGGTESSEETSKDSPESASSTGQPSSADNNTGDSEPPVKPKAGTTRSKAKPKAE